LYIFFFNLIFFYIPAFSYFYIYIILIHYLDFWTCSRILVFEFKCCFYSIGQEKSSAILCGPPISLETEINYPYLHGWPQKYKSARMWSYWIPRLRTLFYLVQCTALKIEFIVIFLRTCCIALKLGTNKFREKMKGGPRYLRWWSRNCSLKSYPGALFLSS